VLVHVWRAIDYNTYGLFLNVVECVRCGVDDLSLDLIGPTTIVLLICQSHQHELGIGPQFTLKHPAAAPTSPLAMVMALPLSSDSTAARRSTFCSNRSASFTSKRPRFSGVSFLQLPSKALRAADTAMSTSFSVASWTEQMTDSSQGLITSKVLPSTPFTNSLLMKLSNSSVPTGGDGN
jgi:hypothetical protein